MDPIDTDDESKKVRVSSLAYRELVRRSAETRKTQSELVDAAILGSLDVSRNLFIVEGAALLRQLQLLEYVGQQLVNSNLLLAEVVASGEAGAVKALLAAGAEARALMGEAFNSHEAAKDGGAS